MRLSARICSPSSVSASRRPTRANSLKPRSRSSPAIWRDRAGWVTCSRSAAVETVPCSATATKARRGLRSMAAIYAGPAYRTRRIMHWTAPGSWRKRSGPPVCGRPARVRLTDGAIRFRGVRTWEWSCITRGQEPQRKDVCHDPGNRRCRPGFRGSRPPRAGSISTTGSATNGRCCSRTRRISRRSAPPSSATWRRSSRSSTSAASRSSGSRSIR